jgi:hypothetical protein
MSDPELVICEKCGVLTTVSPGDVRLLCLLCKRFRAWLPDIAEAVIKAMRQAYEANEPPGKWRT